MALLGELAARFPGVITDIRGKGLMIGIEFDSPERAEAVQWAAFERGLLVLECGKQTVRMCPPLIVTADEMVTGVRIFGEAVAAAVAHPGQVIDDAVQAGAMHDGEVDG
jgi:4-aminobutyrate aminotransferase